MDIETLTKHAANLSTIVQAMVVAGTALVALWAWLKELRAKSLGDIIPAVVALTQDAKAMSWSDKGRPLADVAGEVAKNLKELAAKRGLGELTAQELDRGKAEAAAIHKAAKLDAVGYTGSPDDIPPIESPAPGADPGK